MDYGVAVRNKFELFLDDEDTDPLEILRLQEEENAKKKVEPVKGKDAKSQKDSKSAKNKKNNKAQTTAQDQKTKPVESKDVKKDDKPLRNKSRNDDRPNRGPRENYQNRDRDYQNRDRDLPPRRQQQQDGRPVSSGGFGQTSPPGGDQFRERGEGRGRGRGRGGRGGGRGRGGFDRFGKREFERHSGSDKTSGIKATEKREGAGAHNWGTVKDDVDDQMNRTAPADGNDKWAAQSEDTENVQPDAAPETNEEGGQEEETGPSEMTLDEWKALQIKEKQTQSFNVRKPGEGCDSKQWKQTYVLKKKANEDDEEESEEEEDDDEMDHRRKNYVPIEITFGDSRRGGGRGGRGGRGRGRDGDSGGGRGRGGDMERRGRGGRGGGPTTGRGGRREQAPNVEDELDFPSLVKP